MPPGLIPFYEAFSPPQQRAALLLVLLNAAASPGYKSRYRRRWWQILEERAKLGALTSASLVEWSSSVCSRLGGSIGRNVEHRAAWQEIVSAGEESLVLDALETSTPALIAFVRAWGDLRREAWEDEQEAKDAAAANDAVGAPLTEEEHDLLWQP
jgi:hypothetical protein